MLRKCVGRQPPPPFQGALTLPHVPIVSALPQVPRRQPHHSHLNRRTESLLRVRHTKPSCKFHDLFVGRKPHVRFVKDASEIAQRIARELDQHGRRQLLLHLTDSQGARGHNETDLWWRLRLRNLRRWRWRRRWPCYCDLSRNLTSWRWRRRWPFFCDLSI